MFFRILLIIFFWTSSCFALSLEKTNLALSYLWGMTWLDSTKILITEKKSKKIILFDTENIISTNIEHQIPVAVSGQGGLLDIISEDNNIWITCSIMKEKRLTTAIFNIVP